MVLSHNPSCHTVALLPAPLKVHDPVIAPSSAQVSPLLHVLFTAHPVHGNHPHDLFSIMIHLPALIHVLLLQSTSHVVSVTPASITGVFACGG